MPEKMPKCGRCGCPLGHPGATTCADCLDREEEEYARVKTYLNEHPRAPVPEVSEEADVPVPVIMKWLRQGRLSADELPPEVVAQWVQALDEAQRLQARFAERARAQAREGGGQGEGNHASRSGKAAYVAHRRSTRAS